MFKTKEDMRGRLNQFNRRWLARHQAFASCCGGGWWGLGTVIDGELRARYEGFLPVDAYCRDLSLVAEDFLQDGELVPNALRGGVYASLPDFWAVLEERFGGRVTVDYEELLALLCNVAEPSRMGTSAGRYPSQLVRLRELSRVRSSLRILDLGCGVGLGTYELADQAQACCSRVQVCGVTAEGLEVWMATHRRLPHDRVRESQFSAFGELDISFVKGLAQDYCDGSRYDVIVCNGLAGGRYLHEEESLREFLQACLKNLGGSGVMLLSNHFHEGFRPGVELLCSLAGDLGGQVEGDWQSLELRFT